MICGNSQLSNILYMYCIMSTHSPQLHPQALLVDVSILSVHFLDWYLTLIDNIFLATYVMELGMKFYVWRLKYFKSMWNVFGMYVCQSICPVVSYISLFNSIFPDFVIVVASFIDFLTPLIVQNTANFNAEVFKVLRIFRAIRALRALRVLRTIRCVCVCV